VAPVRAAPEPHLLDFRRGQSIFIPVGNPQGSARRCLGRMQGNLLVKEQYGPARAGSKKED